MSTVLFQVEEGVARITLNRPDVFNAFDDDQSYALQSALKEANRNDEVRVVVLTGAGKAFCSGQDLKSIKDSKDRDLSESLHKRYNPIIRAMREMPKPIIGRINGVAAGAGCSLALACDLSVAAHSAKFIEVFVNVGLVLDSGSSYFLPRLVGSARAFEMSTLASRIDAQTAAQWGLINKAVPDEELDQAVNLWVDHYRQAPTKAIGLMKKMLNRSFHSDLDQMLDYEALCQGIAGRSEDHKEGVAAFNEKRSPVFRGL
jgi:2-(1,2-epoxy-1,2-dihydrophenyl)acetyl-CoA isomerase